MYQEHDFSMYYKKVSLKDPHTLDDLDIEWLPQATQKVVEKIFNSVDFISAETEREQVKCLYEQSRNRDSPLGIRQVASIFNLPKTTIERHLNQPIEDRVSGRPKLLSEQEHNELKLFIQDGIKKYEARTIPIIREFIYNNFQKDLSCEKIRHYIYNSSDFKIVKGSPLETARALVETSLIDDYFKDLKEVFACKIPSSFVFNIDEMGYSEYYDSRKKKCVVPNNYIGNSIQFAVNRNTSHSTLLGGITAAGDVLRPLIIGERETIEMELLNLGYTPKKLMLAKTKSGYINQETFQQWIKNYFFSDVKEMRNKENYSETAILILDNLNCHVSDNFRELCEIENIAVKPIPPHSSDQLQPLDIGIFANLKYIMTNANVQKHLNPQSRRIIKMYDSYYAAASPRNAVKAFRSCGIVSEYDIESQCAYARIDTSYAKKVRHLQQQSSSVLASDKLRVFL